MDEFTQRSNHIRGTLQTSLGVSSGDDRILMNEHIIVRPDRRFETPVYLDYNATTPLASEVIDAITSALKIAWGNPSSSHSPGVLARTVINEARDRVACMIGAKTEDIIFTSGGTEANNMVLHSVVREFHSERTLSGETALGGETALRGETLEDSGGEERHACLGRPHIITSNLEHDSVSLVLKNMETRREADVTYAPASHDTGHVTVDDILNAVKAETCLITVMLANNETGILQPIREIAARVAALRPERNAASLPRIYVHTDAAQAIGKIRVDVDELGVDFLTIVGHKFYGPRIGALFVRRPGSETPLHPMFYGGGQERNFRPGTENTPMIAGLGMACHLVSKNIDSYKSGMEAVRDYLEEKLQETFRVTGVEFNGRINGVVRLPNTCNVSVIGTGLRGAEVLSRCKLVQASVGAACHTGLQHSASCVLLASGVPEHIAFNAIRLSVGRETTQDDVDVVVSDIAQAVHSLTDLLKPLPLHV